MLIKPNIEEEVKKAQKELNRRNGSSVPDRPNRASGGMSEVAYEKENEFDGMPR